MKHQELLHVHGLLAEVATYLTENGEVTVDMTEYRTVGTRPMSIDHAKGAHEDAIAALAGAIVEDLDASDDGAVEADERATEEGSRATSASPTPG